jgi:8-oxo-dGTP pyrophosphatase MutT (NUDIX family)
VSEPILSRVSRIEARCEPFRWEWAEANRMLVMDHWERRRAAQPRLFNGPVLLAAEIGIMAGVLRATYFRTDYASFLAFKELGFPDPAVANGFAMAALVTTDEAYVLGVMSPHTANAGKIYFPGGTPDPSDLRQDGSVDLAGSVVRELREETGLGPDGCDFAQDWVVVRDGATLAMLKPARLRQPGAVVRTRILEDLARDDDPELSGVRLVRSAADIDEARMPRFIQTYLRWRFAGSPEPDQG